GYLAQIGGVQNQQQTEKCVGFSIVSCIALRAAALDLTLPRGSELAVVAIAQQLEMMGEGTPNAPLLDNGCSPALAVQGIRRFGLPSQASFPFDVTRTAEKIDVSELEDADRTIGLFVHEFLGIT